MIRKILSKIETIVNDNWLNPLLTIYINFCCLPLRQAIKLPIFVYGRPKLFVANGVIEMPDICRKGMVKFNISRRGVTENTSHSELRINGKIIFHGNAIIAQGSTLDVNGIFEAGDCLNIQSDCFLGCYNHVVVGKSLSMAHRSQLLDSNEHWMANMTSRIVRRFSSPIVLGNYCWLCSSSLTLGGARLPHHSILSAFSMLNKDYSREDEGCLFAGIPAKVIKRQIYRFGGNELDKYVCHYFRSHIDDSVCPLPHNTTTEELTYYK